MFICVKNNIYLLPRIGKNRKNCERDEQNFKTTKIVCNFVGILTSTRNI